MKSTNKSISSTQSQKFIYRPLQAYKPMNIMFIKQTKTIDKNATFMVNI